MDSSEQIVEARGIKKVYEMGPERVEALRGVDISIQTGEFVGIMGPSGSGKSTLMHILGCLEKATEGTYLLGGQDISRVSDHDLSLMRANQIGFVFQTFNLIPQYSVLENVAMPFLYRKETRNEAGLLAERAIERVGLSARCNHKPSDFPVVKCSALPLPGLLLWTHCLFWPMSPLETWIRKRAKASSRFSVNSISRAPL